MTPTERRSWNIVTKSPFTNAQFVYPLQQKRLSRLLEGFKKNPNIKKAIVFGSSVTPRCHIDSDLDIYVELANDCKRSEIYGDNFYDFPIDLWTNFTVDDNLKKEIEDTGVVVYG